MKEALVRFLREFSNSLSCVSRAQLKFGMQLEAVVLLITEIEVLDSLKEQLSPRSFENLFRFTKKHLSWNLSTVVCSTRWEKASKGMLSKYVWRVLTLVFGVCRFMRTSQLHLPVKETLQITQWGLTRWVVVLHLLSLSWYAKMFEWHLEEEEPRCISCIVQRVRDGQLQ